MNKIDTIEYKGGRVLLYQDEDADSPRDWDNVGEILYTSRHYNLGDRRTTSEEIQSIVDRHDVVYLPVYAYIHSSTRLNTTGFSCPWDSGQCGIIWCTKARAIKEWGKTRFTKAVQKHAEDYLRGEIQTLSSYYEGDVVGFVAEDEDGGELDSCWGFYPDPSKPWSERYADPLAQGKVAIDAHLLKVHATAEVTHA